MVFHSSIEKSTLTFIVQQKIEDLNLKSEFQVVFQQWNSKNNKKNFTLFRMGIFGAAHEWGEGGQKGLKICHTYPTMMKLGTVIPYVKKIQKIYESQDTHLDFC